jgi:hypothetical protein
MNENRTLAQILEAAKSGEPTTHEECLYAMLALDSLLYFETRDGMLCPKSRDPHFELCRRQKASHDRRHRVLNMPPRDWIGPEHDPANPEYLKWRNAMIQITDRMIDQVLGNEVSE